MIEKNRVRRYVCHLNDEQLQQIKLGETIPIEIGYTIIYISRAFPNEKELKRRAIPLKPEMTKVEEVDMNGNVVKVHHKRIACPTCGHHFVHGLVNFCENCGQAIDLKYE